MNSGLISTRYAEALLQYAIILKQEEKVYDRMKILSEMFMRIPGLHYTIMDPSVSASEKKNIITTASGGDIPLSLSKMIDLILKNEREEVLQYIALRYIDLYRDKFHILNGRLITAVTLDHERELQLFEGIRKMVNTEIEVETVVDPTVIGGFILILGDYRWDASISGELTRIKNKFHNI